MKIKKLFQISFLSKEVCRENFLKKTIIDFYRFCVMSIAMVHIRICGLGSSVVCQMEKTNRSKIIQNKSLGKVIQFQFLRYFIQTIKKPVFR